VACAGGDLLSHLSNGDPKAKDATRALGPRVHCGQQADGAVKVAAARADYRSGRHRHPRGRRSNPLSYVRQRRRLTKAVALVDPHVRKTLEEINACLLLGTGEAMATGVRRSPDGGVDAMWALSWPQQQTAGINPIVIRAYFGRGALHPHLRSGTVGDWPLNVFDEEQAAAELPTLRAIASTDIQNLVFQLGGDVRIIPAILNE